ncbi:MAG: hypothetical protein GY913_26750 [Proteobacteria bacterium]|nr:hypothetical protein [Pseudomonadota bacterium]MCP4920514.1 hypothetical protein [Pseudomonadota bacterium]
MSDGAPGASVRDRRGALLIAAGFVLPLLAALCSGAISGVLPEDVLWLSAARAGLLTLPRHLLLLWLPWGLWVAVKHRHWFGGVALALGLGALGVPPYLPEAEGGIVVVAANVQAYSDVVTDLEVALAELETDVVLTIEKRGEKIEGMKRVADNYDRDLPRTSHGMAVFCRRGVLCAAEITEEFGQLPSCGMPMALVRAQASVCIVGIHSPPPAPTCADGLVPYVDEVASHIEDGRVVGTWGPCQDEDPVLVIGDLNYVPNSRVHRTLLDRGLTDTATIHGVWAATWPAGGGWPDLPFFRLDQLLVGDPIDASGLRYERLPDADHKAVRARITLAD